MAKTLLNAVNEILKRVSLIAGDNAALTSLTDSARQTPIDIAIQVINEGNDDLYTLAEIPLPIGQAESTITMVEGTLSYALASDLVRLRFPLRDKTNSQFITEHPGGYNEMLNLDIEQDDTGLALTAAINPVNGELHLDRAPSSNEAGRVYTYQYDKDLAMTVLTDTVPYTDIVFRQMVPAWTEMWKEARRGSDEFDRRKLERYMGNAARVLARIPPRSSWSNR